MGELEKYFKTNHNGGLSIHEVLEKGFMELYQQNISDKKLAIQWLGEYILKTNPNTPHIINEMKKEYPENLDRNQVKSLFITGSPGADVNMQTTMLVKDSSE